MRPARSRLLAAGFLWTAASLVAVWTLGSAALSGEIAVAAFLAVWSGAALFGLWSAGRGGWWSCW